MAVKGWPQKLALVVSILAAGYMLFIAFLAARWQLGTDPHLASLLPFPGLYLAELAAIGSLAVVAVRQSQTDQGKVWLQALWGLVGALMAVVILGAWTIGGPLLPALAGLVLAAILVSYEHESVWLRRLVIMAAAGLLQAGFMLMVVLLF